MEDNQLEQLKKAHTYFASAVQILTQRVQFYAEEFQTVSNTVAFLSHLRDDAWSKVQELEPAKSEEKKVYDMDLTHIKPEVETTVS